MESDIKKTMEDDLEAGLNCYNYFLVRQDSYDNKYHQIGTQVSIATEAVALGHANPTIDHFLIIAKREGATVHNLKTNRAISEAALNIFFKSINNGATELFEDSMIGGQ